MASIKISVRRLFELSKKSKSYEVTLSSSEVLSGIVQSKSKGYVECLLNGKMAKFDKDCILSIQD